MSNLLDKASVILTPTAYNTSEALCVKPSDGTGDFDFSRATEATRINSLGLVETIGINLPRINYEGGCGSWLFEPQSTNLFDYSEDLGNSYWSDFGTEVSRNLNASQINPSGTAGSYELEGVGGLRRFGIFLTVTPSTDYTLSFYAKNIDATLLKALFTNSSITTYTYTSEVNTTDWSRVEINFTTLTGTSTSVQILRDLPIGESAFFWGLMLEEQSYATSYIPSNGGQVTRNKDLCNNGATGTGLINSTEGVLYAEIAALANDATNRVISISDGTASQRISIVLGTSSNQIRGQVLSSSTSFDFSTTSYNTLNNNKIAISYKLNDFSMWINGTKVSTDTSGNTPVGMNTISFNEGAATLDYFGKTKCIAVWKEALTDAELTSLTTI
tara:strand:+ start:374 stop:1534 length:1161 start_codon:yes stop_codon:yes gene_type:complete